MKLFRRSNISYLYSIIIHVILIMLFYFVNLSRENEEIEYVTVGFGTFGQFSSTSKASKEEDIKKKTEPAEKEKKDVELPKTVNVDQENISTTIDDKEEPKKEEKEKTNLPKFDEDKGLENQDSGLGNFGITFDWGGQGKRRIYSWVIPPYPPGVAKEIDVKLRFSILPDGTVGRILPLIKADTRLENAAITSLRQWRFEPLNSKGADKEQTVVIIFPFRLQ